MQSRDDLKKRLENSKFRFCFRLRETELKIIAEKGLDEIRAHCRRILQQRLAPAFPQNDGKQTPMKGHPCFVAQHATGICCRGCLQKWHNIPSGRALTDAETEYLTEILMEWIREHSAAAETLPHTPDLFR